MLQVLGRSAGGIARHVAFLSTAVTADGRAGVEVAGPPDLPIEMPEPFHEVTIPDGPLLGHRRAVRALRDLLDRRGFDVIHAHGLRAGIDAGAGARRSGTPVLVTVHNLVRADISGPLRARLYRTAERVAVRRATRVFCVSGEIAEHLRATVPGAASKIEVLYLGIGEVQVDAASSDGIRSELGLGSGTRLVVTASRLAPQKNLPVMFEAIAGLPDAVLAVLGEGPLEADLRDAAASVAPGRVRFLGFRDNVLEHLRAADAFCLSSVWEGVPLAAQEAILVGTPVVATAVGGMPELIEDRVSGRLVPDNDPAALRAALHEVLEGGERVRSYTERARADLLERFSTRKMIERLALAYEEAAQRR
ncbi:MAG: glycosyltransferase family 4 protein [Actinomycetota bacterium]